MRLSLERFLGWLEKEENRAKGKKITKRLAIIFYTLAALSLVLLFLKYEYLPNQGIQLADNITGTSMTPTLKAGALVIVVSPEQAPFDELEPGDIIGFKERDDYHSSVITFEFNFDGDSNTASATAKVDPMRGVTTYQDAGINYEDSSIMHRVIEVDTEHGDRTVFTKGDGNPTEDAKPVMASGYEGKAVWYMNYLGYVVRFMTGRFFFPIVLSLGSGFCAIFIFLKFVQIAAVTQDGTTNMESTADNSADNENDAE